MTSDLNDIQFHEVSFGVCARLECTDSLEAWMGKQWRTLYDFQYHQKFVYNFNTHCIAPARQLCARLQKLLYEKGTLKCSYPVRATASVTIREGSEFGKKRMRVNILIVQTCLYILHSAISHNFTSTSKLNVYCKITLIVDVLH